MPSTQVSRKTIKPQRKIVDPKDASILALERQVKQHQKEKLQDAAVHDALKAEVADFQEKLQAKSAEIERISFQLRVSNESSKAIGRKADNLIRKQGSAAAISSAAMAQLVEENKALISANKLQQEAIKDLEQEKVVLTTKCTAQSAAMDSLLQQLNAKEDVQQITELHNTVQSLKNDMEAREREILALKNQIRAKNSALMDVETIDMVNKRHVEQEKHLNALLQEAKSQNKVLEAIITSQHKQVNVMRRVMDNLNHTVSLAETTDSEGEATSAPLPVDQFAALNQKIRSQQQTIAALQGSNAELTETNKVLLNHAHITQRSMRSEQRKVSAEKQQLLNQVTERDDVLRQVNRALNSSGSSKLSRRNSSVLTAAA
eukprot:TRINITY_DN3689_c0_g1_i3.p1 TRINITY_DN3689_c0_g1~~TRINITY_DN3689_c0_g1_i3.p1  ORF type:complete len:375 (+),score=109.90 TRINITY_DN3689_c0_g1_i3:235-1359(+)